jgi:hypothetical protein
MKINTCRNKKKKLLLLRYLNCACVTRINLLNSISHFLNCGLIDVVCCWDMQSYYKLLRSYYFRIMIHNNYMSELLVFWQGNVRYLIWDPLILLRIEPTMYCCASF